MHASILTAPFCSRASIFMQTDDSACISILSNHEIHSDITSILKVESSLDNPHNIISFLIRTCVTCQKLQVCEFSPSAESLLHYKFSDDHKIYDEALANKHTLN